MKITIKREQKSNLFEFLPNESNLREAKITFMGGQNPDLFEFLPNESNLREAKITFMREQNPNSVGVLQCAGYLHEVKKPRTPVSGRSNALILKISRVMKLTMIILFSTSMLVSAGLYSQTTRLTLTFSSISYSELFSKIEDQSEFSFAFTGSNFDPNKKIKVDVSQGTLAEILAKVLPDNVTYEIIDRYVVIRNADNNNPLPGRQQKSVSGKVTDSSGNALPGVSVVVKGTTRGIITDAGGSYSLDIIPSDATLLFSFVGM
jgi:hypothetical protein